MALSLSSGHSTEYLTDQVAQGRESYYLDATTAGEPPGRWWGTGAEALGLTGEVDAEVMKALYTEFADPTDPAFADPATRSEARRLGRAPGRYQSAEEIVAARLAAEPGALPERVREIELEARRAARQPVMFMDATFSPVKSFTVLHTALHRAETDAARAGDEPAREMWAGLRADAEAALWAGNRAMLDTLSKRAGYSRAGRHGAGAGRWVDAHDWTVASFHQSDSRDHDPQQHIHNAILNRVQCADGEWRALDSRALHEWKQAAGAIGERVMEEELSRRLGVRWQLRPDGAGREIVGISQSALDLFSERSRHITGRVAERVAEFEERFGRPPTALELARLRQQATLGTRRAKTHLGENMGERLDRWDRELRAEVAGGLHQVAKDVAAQSLRGPIESEEWSPSGVIAEAIAAAQETHAAFSESELTRHLVMHLPDLGGLDADQVDRLVRRLETQAKEDLVVVTGHQPTSEVPEELRLANGRSVYAAPGGPRYATPEHLVAEQALRRAAVERGRAAATRQAAEEWLAAHGESLGVDQAAAARGLLTSGAAVSVLIGPAGTGKSYTLGVTARAWEQLTGGRLLGLATAQIAADVLTEDGVTATNTARWLAAMRRLDQPGQHRSEDERWRLTSQDMIVLDESSMADLNAVAEIRRRVEAAGARLILAGDPRQLGAVGAGGTMDLVGGADHADVHHLRDVRRFSAVWEREASLRLRDGDVDVLAEYDRHGRLRGCADLPTAMHDAATAYVADVVSGRSAVVVVPTNSMASELSAKIRERLVNLGRVAPDGVLLRDQTTAGIGDVIQAREIDRKLNLVNRSRYRVDRVLPDGGLVVIGEDGKARQVPAEYVTSHVTLAYAGTIHAAEGVTVDAGYQIATGQTSNEANYVGATRGRHTNVTFVPTSDPVTGRVADHVSPGDAHAFLADLLSNGHDVEQAALLQAAESARDAGSMYTLAARIEDGVRQVCRQRLDEQLDALTAAEALTDEQRRLLAADQGSEQLARLLRAVEQAGHDPGRALADAVSERELTDSRSLAQVLHYRVMQTYGRDLTPSTNEATPAGISPEWQRYFEVLTTAADDRRRELGSIIAAETPAWAVTALGPVPDEVVARAEWEHRAAAVAAYREATGWADEAEAIGPAPGLSNSERRAAWHTAWTALDRPDQTEAEHVLSEGALRNRVRAWESEQAWAPADVYAQQRAASQTLQDARVAADMARATGGDVAAVEERVEMLAQTCADLDQAADVRAAWLTETALTHELAGRAEAELASRGRPIGAEDDRTTVEEWLAAHAEDQVAEEAVRQVTESDLLIEPSAPVVEPMTRVVDQERVTPEAVQEKVTAEPEVIEARSEVPTRTEVTAITTAATVAATTLADRRSQEAAQAEHEATERAEAELAANRDVHYERQAPSREREAVLER